MALKFNPLSGGFDLTFNQTEDTTHVLKAGDTVTGLLTMQSASSSTLAGLFKAAASPSSNVSLTEWQTSTGSVIALITAGAQTVNTTGVLTVYDRGLAKYGDGAIISLHADDETPYVLKLYNETYSSSVPVFDYFAYNNGTFQETVEASQPWHFAVGGFGNIRMTISGSGKVGVNNQNATAQFQTNSSAGSVITAIFKAASSPSSNIANTEWHNSAGTVVAMIAAGAQTDNKIGVLTVYDRGIAKSGDGAIISAHTDDETPYLVKLYNDTYSTTVPAFDYFAYNTGEFQQTVEANQAWRFATNGFGNIRMSIMGDGKIGLGVLAPTANVHIKAGSATANTAPLKITSGTFNTTAEAGALEYNGRFALTESDATRRYVAQATASTKTTAGAPYTNDGYVTLTINGTDVKVMTTA